MVNKDTGIRFLLLVAGFLALYALTAQRGLGWGDSGEFQHRILHCADALSGCESFATAHPLYVMLGQLLCHTPFQVTLLSSFFGALAVGGLYLCTRRASLAILFGLSHMLWWLSCLAEVQTMNLAFTAFETFLLLRHVDTGKAQWLIGASFLTGLHLSCHNLAVLAGPAFLYLFLRAGWKNVLLSVLAGCLGASYWLYALVTRGFGEVLVGRYGAQVAGVLPENALVTGFNFALAALSFTVPALLLFLLPSPSTPNLKPRNPKPLLFLLLGVNALFFLRYFVPDQATFLLPTLFFTYLVLGTRSPGPRQTLFLAAVQILLPLLAWTVLAQLPAPANRTPHKYRDDAAYFALPWKHTETSADRAAAEREDPWTGYPVR